MKILQRSILMKWIPAFAGMTVYCFAAILAGRTALALQVEKIAKISVHFSEGEAHKINERDVLDIIAIKEGATFSTEKMEKAVNYLKKWGIFEEISASTMPSKEGMQIDLYVKEAPLIGEIDIKGNYPYIEQKIRKYLTVRPGDIYTRAKIDEQIERIKEFYSREGFFNTKVSSSESWNETTRDVKAKFEIKHGSLLRYGKINIEGGNKTIKGRIYSYINPLRPYTPRKFNTAIRRAIDYYHSHGRPRARIKAEVRTDVDAGKVHADIKVSEGPKVKVKIIGNKKIGDRKLKKAITIFEEGSFDEYEISSSKEKLLGLYLAKGYPDIEIYTERKDQPNGNIMIEFHIKEGKKLKTAAVKKSKEKIKLPVKNISFIGNTSVDKEILLKKLKNKIGKLLNVTVLEDDKNRISSYYSDHGWPYVEVSQFVDTLSDGVEIRHEISEGIPVKIGRIFVVGNSLTTTRAIKKAITIHEGAPYSFEKITESQLALRRLGVFNTVTFETLGLEEKEAVVHVVIKVEEAKPFAMDFGLAYSTDERYSGSIGFTNFNSFGMAKRSNLKLTGGRELSRAEANWIDPRFFGSDFEMTTSTWLQYQDKNTFNYMQAGGGLGFFRRFHRTGILAKYELERNYFVEGDSVAADASSLRDNTISKVTLSASFDTRNNFADPTRGIFAMMNTDIFNEVRGNQANFVKLRWFFSNYWSFWKRLSFSNNARLDRIQALGHVSVPSNELFLMGGDDTLRGFSEDSLGPVNSAGQATGGRVRWIYNAELHIKLLKNWQGAIFYDTGSLTSEFSQINLETVRQSVGFGVRYITPVGPIRFDYGIILDKLAGDNFGRFHLTFGYVF